jgi:hypothetical protein
MQSYAFNYLNLCCCLLFFTGLFFHPLTSSSCSTGCGVGSDSGCAGTGSAGSSRGCGYGCGLACGLACGSRKPLAKRARISSTSALENL